MRKAVVVEEGEAGRAADEAAGEAALADHKDLQVPRRHDLRQEALEREGEEGAVVAARADDDGGAGWRVARRELLDPVAVLSVLAHRRVAHGAAVVLRAWVMKGFFNSNLKSSILSCTSQYMMLCFFLTLVVVLRQSNGRGALPLSLRPTAPTWGMRYSSGEGASVTLMWR